jgi:hypothetical protein
MARRRSRPASARSALDGPIAASPWVSFPLRVRRRIPGRPPPATRARAGSAARRLAPSNTTARLRRRRDPANPVRGQLAEAGAGLVRRETRRSRHLSGRMGFADVTCQEVGGRAGGPAFEFRRDVVEVQLVGRERLESRHRRRTLAAAAAARALRPGTRSEACSSPPPARLVRRGSCRPGADSEDPEQQSRSADRGVPASEPDQAEGAEPERRAKHAAEEGPARGQREHADPAPARQLVLVDEPTDPSRRQPQQDGEKSEQRWHLVVFEPARRGTHSARSRLCRLPDSDRSSRRTVTTSGAGRSLRAASPPGGACALGRRRCRARGHPRAHASWGPGGRAPPGAAR